MRNRGRGGDEKNENGTKMADSGAKFGVLGAEVAAVVFGRVGA